MMLAQQGMLMTFITRFSAGVNQNISAGSTATMAAVAPVGLTVNWSTSGTGRFSSKSSLTAVYTPSDTDIALGSAILTLTGGTRTSSILLTIALPTINYGALSNVVFHSDYAGLVINTTNSAGTVDGSGNVTRVNSVSPAPTGNDFFSNGTAPTLSADGVVNTTAGRLRANTSTVWANPLAYNPAFNNIKGTIHMVVKIGTSENPNATYGIIGNNGTSTTNRGFSVFYIDGANNENSLRVTHTKGTTSIFLSDIHGQNVIPPNRFFVLTVEWDFNLSTPESCKIFINGVEMLNLANGHNNSVPVTTPNHEVEIGGAGNAITSGEITWKEVTIQTGVETSSVRNNHIWGLLNKYSSSVYRVEDGVVTDRTFNLLNTFSDGAYYLPVTLNQDPTNPDWVIQLMTQKAHHLQSGTTQRRRSDTYARQFNEAKATVQDIVGEGAMGMCSGYGSTGRLYLLFDGYAGSETSPSGNTKAYSTYSDDFGVTWSSNTNITSSLHADGLNGMQFPGGSIIRHNGYLIAPYYKITGFGDFTQSASYILRAVDDGGTPTWTSYEVRAVGSTYINEARVASLGGSALIQVIRDESTNEFRQYYSNDNGETWTDQGALTPETINSPPAPCELTSFMMGGVRVVAMYYGDRVSDYLKVWYAKASDFSGSGVSAWNASTKITISQIPSGAEHYHYGSVLHYLDNFQARGTWIYDTYPGSGGTTNDIHTFEVPTWHYNTVKTALGI